MQEASAASECGRSVARRCRVGSDRRMRFPDFHGSIAVAVNCISWRVQAALRTELSVGDFVSFLAANAVCLAGTDPSTSRKWSAPLQRGARARGESVFPSCSTSAPSRHRYPDPAARTGADPVRAGIVAYPGTRAGGRPTKVSVSVEPGETIALVAPRAAARPTFGQSAAAILRATGGRNPDRWDRHERDWR